MLAAGPVTGVGSPWTSPGWRTARSADGAATDPWALGASTDLPGALGIGAAGELTVGGLEWLGARVYDPASRGFLSVDPLDPVPGAGWAGNPYSYAGNDPLHALDPLGLRPVTDAELKAYAAAHQAPCTPPATGCPTTGSTSPAAPWSSPAASSSPPASAGPPA